MCFVVFLQYSWLFKCRKNKKCHLNQLLIFNLLLNLTLFYIFVKSVLLTNNARVSGLLATF